MRSKEWYERRIFALLYIVTVPLFTLLFGIIRNPVNYTLSRIGYMLQYRTSFILWGVVTGFLLVGYVLHIYKKAHYNNYTSKNLLYLSYAFLFLTVLIPAAREADPFMHALHIGATALFVGCLLASIIMFIRDLHRRMQTRRYLPAILLAICIDIPLAMLIGYGKLTGVAEITFFVCLTTFLVTTDVFLMRSKNLFAQLHPAKAQQ